MDPNTPVRPVPAWILALSILAAIAGIATLFLDGPAQIPLYVIALGGSAVYFRDRHQATKGAQR